MEVFLDAFEAFVGVNFWTMLFAWCNLLILYLFLKKLLFKPLKNMIDSRQKEVDDMYENAESAEKDAAALKAEYEEKMKQAKEESEAILKKAVRHAKLREEEILKEADAKAQRVMKRAEEEVELEKKRAINEAKDEVSEMALAIAGAVLARDVKKEEHADMIDAFIREIGESK